MICSLLEIQLVSYGRTKCVSEQLQGEYLGYGAIQYQFNGSDYEGSLVDLSESCTPQSASTSVHLTSVKKNKIFLSGLFCKNINKKMVCVCFNAIHEKKTWMVFRRK